MSIIVISVVQILHESNFYRYYESDEALKSHWRSKVHRRRCKQLREPAYTIEEAERAAGLGRENKRPTTASTSTEVTMTVEV